MAEKDKEKKQKAETEAAPAEGAAAAAHKKGGKKATKPAEGAAEETSQHGKKPKAKKAEDKPKDDIKYLVRIVNTDLDGTSTVQYALTGITGVGNRVAKIIARKADVDPNAIMGYLPPEQVDRIKAVLDNLEANMPTWMVNRQRDLYTGENRHLLGTDLVLSIREDINVMKKMRSYKGIRHERGQKVRGQRTRSTGRTGATVGVMRTKAEAAAAAAAAAAPSGAPTGAPAKK